jgi:diaminopimelate decarboxylase
MVEFEYRDNELCCEGIKVQNIVSEVGTPFYLYSYQTLIKNYRDFDLAFSQVDHIVCYSYKANSNLAICKALANEGCGADVVSGGELFKALTVGVDPRKIVFTGVGKTSGEIEYALRENILMINVESTPELESIDRVAGRLGKRAPIALRVNPDIDPKTHPYIATGLGESKFGIDVSKAIEGYKIAQSLPNLKILGVHKHIGSQITRLESFAESLARIVDFVAQLANIGIELEYVDMGGGLGIAYGDEEAPSISDFVRATMPSIKKLNHKMIFEPGRVIVGNSGILVSQVLYLKETKDKTFCIVDAAINDFIRPALYDAYHEIIPVNLSINQDPGSRILVDVVGPICESGDFFARDRNLPALKAGDIVAILDVGAYGFSMSSNYNARPRVPEVMVKGGKYYITRRRESYEDLIMGEEIPEVLKQGK